jgi:hypothetical protein
VTLNVKIVIARVRIAGCAHSQRHPGREQYGADRRAGHLVPHDHARQGPRVRDAEVGLADEHRQQGGGRGVPEGLVHPEQEQRGQHHRDVDPVRQDRRRQQQQDRYPDEAGGDDDRATVEPVGRHPGVDAEQQRHHRASGRL